MGRRFFYNYLFLWKLDGTLLNLKTFPNYSHREVSLSYLAFVGLHASFRIQYPGDLSFIFVLHNCPSYFSFILGLLWFSGLHASFHHQYRGCPDYGFIQGCCFIPKYSKLETFIIQGLCCFYIGFILKYQVKS